MRSAMDLTTFLSDAWNVHGDDADTVAQQLAHRLPEVQSPAEVPAFAALLAHVYGEHLGRWHDALVLLGRLRGVAADDAVALTAVQRAERTLRCASGDGQALDDLPAGERAAVLAGAAARAAAACTFGWTSSAPAAGPAFAASAAGAAATAPSSITAITCALVTVAPASNLISL